MQETNDGQWSDGRASPPRSRVPRVLTEHAGIDAQQRQRLVVTLLDRRVEDDARLGADVDPAVATHLFFELACGPAAVTERDEHFFRAGAVGQRLQHVLAGRHLEAAGYLQRRVVV